MKVLVLAPYVTVPTSKRLSKTRSGFGRCVWNICRYSAKSGLDTYLFTYAFGAQMKLEGVTIVSHLPQHHLHPIYITDGLDAIRVVRSGFRNKLLAKLKLGAAFMFRRYLEELIRKLNPDVIHLHGLTIDTTPFLLASLSSEYPLIATLHGLNALESRVPISEAERRIERVLIEFVNQIGVPISTVSSGVRNKMLHNFHIMKPNSVRVISNGIDVKLFQGKESKVALRAKHDIPCDAQVLLNVGSLVPRKNHADILRAFAEMLSQTPRERQLLLLLVGDGPERSNLEALIESYHLKKWVKMLGHKEGQELVDLYRLADVFVLASTTEGFGLVMLEAMAAGVPVVAYDDLEAIQDLYHPECMQLVSSRDPQALTEALEKALVRSWQREVIQAHAFTFSWENIIQQYVDLYKTAISEFSGSKEIRFSQLLYKT